MKTSDSEELRRVVEEIRAEEFSDLSASLLQEIIDAEEEYPDGSDDARRQIARSITRFLDAERSH